MLLSGLKPMLLQEVVNVAKEFNLDLRGAWVTHEEWPADRPVAGALVGDLAEAPGPIRLRKAECPVVRLEGRHSSSEYTYPAVMPDFAVCGHLAAEHFTERQSCSTGWFSYYGAPASLLPPCFRYEPTPVPRKIASGIKSPLCCTRIPVWCGFMIVVPQFNSGL